MRIQKNNIDITFKYENNSFSSKPNNSSSEILAMFIYLWKHSKDITEDLLPKIEDVLVGRRPFAELGADVVGLAYVKPQTTKLMGSDLGYADLELPTQDFKEIILKWLSFLESGQRKDIVNS